MRLSRATSKMGTSRQSDESREIRGQAQRE